MPNPEGHSDFIDAHPTAPGGMSEAALAAELVEHTDLSPTVIKKMLWREKIERVIQSRLDRGDGKIIQPAGFAVPSETVYTPPEPEFKRGASDDLNDLVDDLWADDDDDLDDDDSAYLGTRVVSAPVVSDADLLATPEEAGLVDTEPDDLDALLDEMTADDLPGMWEQGDLTGGETEALRTEASARFAEGMDLHSLEDVADEFGVDLAAAPVGPGAKTALFLGMPDTLDYIFDGHAGAGPSGAERWMTCTASLGASRRFLETLTPNQQEAFSSGTLAASQGTTAHAAGEAKVNLMLDRITEAEAENILLDLTITPDSAGEAYDSEMEENLDEYVAYAKILADEGHEIQVESRVTAAIPLTGSHEGEVYEITGSADLTALPTPADKVLTVTDLKYGNGLDVSVEANPQVRIYALGVLNGLIDDEGFLTVDIDRVEYVIVQPRLGGIKVWSEPLDDLLDWRDEVLSPALTAALYGADEGATFVPSDEGCQFCPARGDCAALAQDRMTNAAALFDAVVEAEFNGAEANTLDAGGLDSTTLGQLLAQVTGLTSLKDSLKEEAQRRLHRGEEVPGFWLVNYSPVRTWKADAEQGLAKLPKKITHTDPTLRTPKQVLTLLGKDGDKVIGDLIDTPEKRPVISTGAKDKRSKWTERAPEDMFGALPEDPA